MSTFKYAFRALARSPFLTAVAVLSLALGIGANAGIYSIFDRLLLQALPVDAPEELVNLGAPGPNPGSTSCSGIGGCDEIFSYPMYRDLAEADVGFAGLAGHRDLGVNLALGERTVSGEGLMVSGNYFQLLGVQPALGRLFSPADDQEPGTHWVAVLSHDYWERELGSDPGVLNRTLVLNGSPFTVVGVTEPGFRGTSAGSRPDVFVPLSMRDALNESWQVLDNRRAYWVYVFGRLAPGVTLEAADARIGAVYSNILREVEAPLQEGMSPQTLEDFKAKPLLLSPGERGQSSLSEDAQTPLILLLAITGLVLLIACANVANLLLARGAQRGVEMAVRGSLGAGRRQLLSQLLAESVLLAGAAGAASLLVAVGTLRFMRSLMPPEVVQIIPVSLDGRAVLFTGAVALTTGLVFGLFPALHSTRPDLVTIIKGNTGQPSGSRAAHRFRNGLVTAQIALSMTLLVVAGLFIKSLVKVSQVDLGLSTENMITFSVAPVLNGYEPERSAAFFQELRSELEAIPGVTQVSEGMVAVLAGNSWGSDVQVQGFDNEDPDLNRNSRLNHVGAGYFSTLRMPLVAGREFTASDGPDAPRVASVNVAFTRKFSLDGRNAGGMYMSSNGADELDTQIIGVVQDAKYSEVKGDVPPVFFRPHMQDDELGFLVFYVRTSSDPAPVMEAIPGVVRRLAPNLPVRRLVRMEQVVRENVFVDRMIGTMASAFAVLATLLAAVGLYGVLAYTVQQRTREIGLRMALGAEGGRIVGMVLRQVGFMLLVGGVVGAAAAFGLGRMAESLLFGVEGADAAVLAGAVAMVAVVALAAGFVPALRASRVDPMEALRYE